LCRYRAEQRLTKDLTALWCTWVGLDKLNAVDPQLESVWFQPLNPKCDFLVSKFASKCNLCRYPWDCEEGRYLGSDGTCRECMYTKCGARENPVGSCPQGSRVDKTSCDKDEFTMGVVSGGM
jgi:hypothetical protein